MTRRQSVNFPRHRRARRAPWRTWRHALCGASAAGLCLPAAAFKIDVGQPDVSLSLDTTLRYNAAVRTKAQEPALMSKFGIGGGDSLYDKNDLALSRLDLYSEMDLTYKGN